MKTYIYTLSHPTTKKICYIGKTINPKKRFRQHIDSGKNIKNNLVSKWIKSLLNKDLKPSMEIIDEIEGDWEWLEIYWISQFKTWGFKLKNMTEGGEGSTGYSCNKKTRKKISNTKIKKFKSGEIKPVKHTEEWKNELKNKYSINDETIIKLYKEGKTASYISKHINVTAKTVYSRLKKHNLFYLKNKIDLNLYKINELIKSGLNYIQISKIFNVSISVISSKYRSSEYYKKK